MKEIKSNKTKPLIKARNLSVYFERGEKLYKAVDKINFTVYPGEVLAVVGESGSGKTTLGKALLSLWDHTTGKVEIDGETLPKKRVKFITKKNKWIYEKGQMIYQDPLSSLNEVKKISNILSEGIDNFNVLKKEQKESLKKIEKNINDIKNMISYKENSTTYIENNYKNIYEKELNDYSETLRTKNNILAKKERWEKRIQNNLEKIEKNKDYLKHYKKQLKQKISFLKKEKDSNRIILRENRDIDNSELHIGFKDEKEELKLHKNRLAENSKSFKSTAKSVTKKIKLGIANFNRKIIDINNLISFVEKDIKKQKSENIKIIEENYLENLNKEKTLLEDIIDYYKKILDQHEIFVKDHNKKNIKKYYDYLIENNNEAYHIFISLNSWSFKNKIYRIKSLENLKARQKKESINDILSDESKIKTKIDEYIKTDEYINALKKYESILEKSDKKFADNSKKKLKKQMETSSWYKQTIKNLNISLKNEKRKLSKLKKKIKKNNLSKEKEEKLLSILEQVGLPEESLNKYPSQFSGGQRQRIGIARSILTKPKFIIADEPISALDVSLQASIVNLLKSMQKKYNLSIVFIAHDLEMVNYIADRICVLYKGKIVEMGSASSVYEKPVHPYTKALINAQPSMNKIGRKLKTNEYDPNMHKYNEYTIVKEWEVRKNHWVYGTEEEIKLWNKK